MNNRSGSYQHLPIPTYEEAISSRPGSSLSHLGPGEISDDAERQGLLGRAAQSSAFSRSNYAPPTVQSERSSVDTLDGIEVEHDAAEVRREMQQMELEDPMNDGGSQRSLLTYRFKRFTSLTSSLSSLRLPSWSRNLSNFIPSISWLRIDWMTVDANKVVIIGRLFGIVLIVGLLYALIATDILSFGRNRMGMGQQYDPESIRAFVQGQWKERMHIEHHLRHLTQYPHVAGSEGSFVLGEWVSEMFKQHEMDEVHMERFDAYLNYPKKGGRKIAIVEPESQSWEARIEEDTEQVDVFHALSKAGDVTGPLIFANFGSQDDFQRLREKGIKTEGTIALVRYYGSQMDRALKVKAAQDVGAIGCLVYSDPAQDGEVRGPEFPKGRFMPQDGVQRGSVGLSTFVMGDVLTPGWSSTPGNKGRQPKEESTGLVQIPSIPISWNDASHLLSVLKNHGEKMEDPSWTGAPNTEYWTGDPTSPKVRLQNDQDEETLQPIYNIIGTVQGWEQPHKKVIVGNHRDALGLGAASPGSGTAIMIAMSRIFYELRQLGWRPRRTIEFVSWDGGEYNLIGSTEHVESREDDLRQNAIAYLNVGAGVTGIDFHAAASPLLYQPLHRILGRVGHPNLNKPIKEIWDANGIKPSPPDAGSDLAPFYHIAGTPAMDLFFKGQEYPLNSNYDNLDWFLKFGDPNNFEYSAALGEIWALLIVELTDSPLLNLDLEYYQRTLASYLDDFESEYDLRRLPASNKAPADFNMDAVRTAIDSMGDKISRIAQFDQHWLNTIYGSGGFENSVMTIKRVDRNNKLMRFESQLLDIDDTADHGTGDRPNGSGGGLVNRTQYKHVITAPKLWGGDGKGQMGNIETWPSIRQYIAVNDWAKARDEVRKVADIIQRAADSLSM